MFPVSVCDAFPNFSAATHTLDLRNFSGGGAELQRTADILKPSTMKHRNYLPTRLYLSAIIALLSPPAAVFAFSPVSLGRRDTISTIHVTTRNVLQKSTFTNARSGGGTLISLHESSIDVTAPTPDEAAALGARDWPQQFKKAGWSEHISDEQVAIRYILSGTGSVSASLLDKAGRKTTSTTNKKIGPGTLIEITGPAQVDWTVDSGGKGGEEGEMIVLTPGYEETGLLLGVAAAFVVLCGVLVAGAGGQ